MAKVTGEVTIDVESCRGCGMCVESCPTRSLKQSDSFNQMGYRHAEFLPGTGCTACEACYLACPELEAIKVGRLTEDAA